MDFATPLALGSLILVFPLWAVLYYTQKEVVKQQRQIDELKRELEDVKRK